MSTTVDTVHGKGKPLLIVRNVTCVRCEINGRAGNAMRAAGAARGSVVDLCAAARGREVIDRSAGRIEGHACLQR